MTPSLWIGLFAWDGLLAGLILGCFWWSEHVALQARQGKHARAYRLATMTLRVCAGGFVGLLVLMTIVVMTEAR
jgi:hypothetical protein